MKGRLDLQLIQPAHVHARPAANPWTGSIDGAQRHYYFENDE